MICRTLRAGEEELGTRVHGTLLLPLMLRESQGQEPLALSRSRPVAPVRAPG